MLESTGGGYVGTWVHESGDMGTGIWWEVMRSGRIYVRKVDNSYNRYISCVCVIGKVRIGGRSRERVEPQWTSGRLKEIRREVRNI